MYTVCMTRGPTAETPPASQRAHLSIKAVELNAGMRCARLAIDRSLRGQGYGEQLLLDAPGQAVAASEIGGVRLIVVDALDDEAHSFYERYHFIPVRNRERRLVMKVSTAAEALGERWRE